MRHCFSTLFATYYVVSIATGVPTASTIIQSCGAAWTTRSNTSQCRIEETGTYEVIAAGSIGAGSKMLTYLSDGNKKYKRACCPGNGAIVRGVVFLLESGSIISVPVVGVPGFDGDTLVVGGGGGTA